MKHLIIVGLALLPASLMAQSAERQVIATLGGYTEAGNVAVSSTVGEAVIHTHAEAELILTQGFQQYSFWPVGISNPDKEISMNIYPNPATDEVVLSMQLNQPMTMQYRLFNLQGQLMHNAQIPAQQTEYSINVSNLAAGQYLLQVYSTDEAVRQSFQIQKLY